MDFFLFNNESYTHKVTYEWRDTIYPDYLICNEKKYIFVKKIEEGEYGKIYLYDNKEPNGKIVVKVEFTSTEMLISWKLRFLPNNPIIKHRFIGNRSDKLFLHVMEYIPYTMKHFKDKVTLPQWIDMVDDVRKQLLFLYDNGLYYTDVKLDNILCYQTEEGIIVKVADLGSAYCDIDNDQISTFPPSEYCDFNELPDEGFGIINRKDIEYETFLAWQIGILLLSYNCKINYLGFCYMHRFWMEELDKELTNCDNFYKQLINNYLNQRPKNRYNIREPIMQSMQNHIPDSC